MQKRDNRPLLSHFVIVAIHRESTTLWKKQRTRDETNELDTGVVERTCVCKIERSKNLEGMDVGVVTGVTAFRRWWPSRSGAPTKASWSNSDPVLFVESTLHATLLDVFPARVLATRVQRSVFTRAWLKARINPVFRANGLTFRARQDLFQPPRSRGL